MALAYPADEIQKQIEWLPLRNPRENRLGLLRSAIEGKWPKPNVPSAASSGGDIEQGCIFGRHFYAGYAGNKHDPIAEPSLRESFAAETFVQRLLKLWPDEKQIKTWGRDFGRLVV